MAGFEKHLTQLETVVERLEKGDLTLDESVRLFEEGVRLSTACKSELDAAEGRIQVLVDQGNAANGALVARDLQLEADEDEE